MGKITIQCPACPTTIVADEEQAARVAGQGINCPFCGMRIPLGVAPVSSTASGIRNSAGMYRIDCAACGATLNVSEEAWQNLVGKSINCLKCNSEIKISRDGTVLHPPATSPEPALQPVPAATSGPLPAPAAKKCFACGKALEAGEDAVCVSCKARQQADRVVMTVPAEGRLGARPAKIKMREEAPVPVLSCVKCGAEFPMGMPVCPACGVDQKTGKKTKQKKVMAVWPQPGARGGRMKGAGALARLANYGFKLLVVVVAIIAIYYSYKYIVNQLNIASLPPKD